MVFRRTFRLAVLGVMVTLGSAVAVRAESAIPRDAPRLVDAGPRPDVGDMDAAGLDASRDIDARTPAGDDAPADIDAAFLDIDARAAVERDARADMDAFDVVDARSEIDTRGAPSDVATTGMDAALGPASAGCTCRAGPNRGRSGALVFLGLAVLGAARGARRWLRP